MTGGHLWQVIVKTGVAVVCAGLFHSLYLAVFLTTFRSCGSVLRGLLWIAAPVANATGFAVGIWFCERRNDRPHRFIRILLWPLVACSLGAAAVYDEAAWVNLARQAKFDSMPLPPAPPPRR